MPIFNFPKFNSLKISENVSLFNLVFTIIDDCQNSKQTYDLSLIDYSIVDLLSYKLTFSISIDSEKNIKILDLLMSKKKKLSKDIPTNTIDDLKLIFELTRIGSEHLVIFLRAGLFTVGIFGYENINIRDEEGYTLLMRAAQGHDQPDKQKNKNEIIKYLLKRGADKNKEFVYENMKLKAIDFAKANENEEAVKLLS